MCSERAQRSLRAQALYPMQPRWLHTLPRPNPSLAVILSVPAAKTCCKTYKGALDGHLEIKIMKNYKSSFFQQLPLTQAKVTLQESTVTT